MRTCLSDDHPLLSLFAGIFWLGLGTYYLDTWLLGGDAPFGLAWLALLLVLTQNGLALYYLRYGVSGRPFWILRLQKLFEPRWLADDGE